MLLLKNHRLETLFLRPPRLNLEKPTRSLVAPSCQWSLYSEWQFAKYRRSCLRLNSIRWHCLPPVLGQKWTTQDSPRREGFQILKSWRATQLYRRNRVPDFYSRKKRRNSSLWARPKTLLIWGCSIYWGVSSISIKEKTEETPTIWNSIQAYLRIKAATLVVQIHREA